MAKESYDDLIFQLGDLARERLVNKPYCQPAMERVYEAEDALVARREELKGIEDQLNLEDAAYEQYLAVVDQERKQKRELVGRNQRVVDAIESKVKDLRKRVSSSKAELRYAKLTLKKMEAKVAQLEAAGQSEQTLNLSRENIKKTRLGALRKERELEELERELDNALTPAAGAPGAPSILAHKRLLELEDEQAGRKDEHEALMAELTDALTAREQDVQAAEDYLDQTLFLLGEAVYQQRVSDAALAPLYPKLDKVAPKVK